MSQSEALWLDRKSLVEVGTSSGLAGTSCGPEAPEQVYCYLDPEHEDRPIVVDGWVGYGRDQRMRLTKRQAADLTKLLIEALTRV